MEDGALPDDAAARLAALRSQATDDTHLLRLIADEARTVAVYSRHVDALRDETVARLARKGMPMTRIAVLARVSDSYLARRLFNRGLLPRRCQR